MFGFGAKKDQGTYFRFWPREKCNESQIMKQGGGGGRKETRFLPVLSTPSPANFRVVFDSRSSFFAPKPNGKLATQAIVTANAQLSSDIDDIFYSLSSIVFTVLFKGGSRSLQCKYRGI